MAYVMDQGYPTVGDYSMEEGYPTVGVVPPEECEPGTKPNLRYPDRSGTKCVPDPSYVAPTEPLPLPGPGIVGQPEPMRRTPTAPITPERVGWGWTTQKTAAATTWFAEYKWYLISGAVLAAGVAYMMLRRPKAVSGLEKWTDPD